MGRTESQIYKMKIFYLFAAASASPRIFGEGYNGPDFPHVKNLTEIREEFRQAFNVDQIEKQLEQWTERAAKDLKELQEKTTIENIQSEIESGLADLAEKIERFNEEVGDWDDENQKFIQAEMIKMKENLERGFQEFKQDFIQFHEKNERSVKSWTTQAADVFAALNPQTAAAFESMAQNIREGLSKLAINQPSQVTESPSLVEPEVVQPE